MQLEQRGGRGWKEKGEEKENKNIKREEKENEKERGKDKENEKEKEK